MCTINHLAGEVRLGLRSVLPHLNKSPLGKLSLCVAAAPETRSCNTMDIASILPPDTERSDMQYQWLSRFLSAHTIDNDEVMTPFIRQAARIASSSGETLILCIDQTPISDRFGILTVSLRFGGGALPLLWRVQKGTGNIGYDTCEEILDKIRSVIPSEAKVSLLGDRFYGQAGPDKLLPESWMGLSTSPQREPQSVYRGWTKNFGKRIGSCHYRQKRSLSGECLSYRTASSDQYKYSAGTRT